MATTKQRVDKQKEKEKKEKIVLAVLVLILIVVGAVMIPGMLKKKGNAGVSSPASTQTTGTSSSATDSGTPSNSGTPSASGAAASGSPGAATFPEMTTTYQPEAGQLSGFGRFSGNDPFAKLPGQAGTGSSTSPTTTTGSTYTAAVISINGTRTTVTLHSAFPAESQAFTLDSITASSVTVSVTDGSFTGS